MKGLNCYARLYVISAHEKLTTFSGSKSSFLMPDVTLSGLSRPTIVRSVDGGQPDSHQLSGLLTPSTVLLFLLVLMSLSSCSSAPSGFTLGVLTTEIPGQPGLVDSQRLYGFTASLIWLFDQNPTRKVWPMTITNHIRKIQEHAESVIGHVDDRDYSRAHVALDSIEGNIRSARDHIDMLQAKADCAARPAGDTSQ